MKKNSALVENVGADGDSGEPVPLVVKRGEVPCDTIHHSEFSNCWEGQKRLSAGNLRNP